MRPRTIDEVVGQEKLLGPGKALRRMIEEDRLRSLILWGPPGTGKTTIARVVAAANSCVFVPFSAVTAGIKEVKQVMAEAATRRRATASARSSSSTRSIGSTRLSRTRSFRTSRMARSCSSVRRPRIRASRSIRLCSRDRRSSCSEPLSIATLVGVLWTGDRRPRADFEGVEADDAELERIGDGMSGGDARSCAEHTGARRVHRGHTAPDGIRRLDRARSSRESLQRAVRRYDKKGEEHYNLISALDQVGAGLRSGCRCTGSLG